MTDPFTYRILDAIGFVWTCDGGVLMARTDPTGEHVERAWKVEVEDGDSIRAVYSIPTPCALDLDPDKAREANAYVDAGAYTVGFSMFDPYAVIPSAHRDIAEEVEPGFFEALDRAHAHALECRNRAKELFR